MNRLDRYRNNECIQVWTEIVTLGDAAHDDEDAVAVSMEMMRRVRKNIEALIERWKARGYEFGYGWAKAWAKREIAMAPPLLGAPTDVDREALLAFERDVGPIPLSLRAFASVVGAVNFVGSSDDFPDRESFDPLQVFSIVRELERAKESDEETLRVSLFGDPLVKFFISGVGAFYTELPCADADATVMFEGDEVQIDGKLLSFVPYLRTVILEQGGIGIGCEDLPRFAEQMSEGLQPF